MWPKNLHHFLNLWDNFRFNTVWHWLYMIIFCLTWIDIDKLWLYLSCVRDYQKVTSLSCHQSRVWADYIGDNSHAADIVPPSIALAFVTKMSEKCKSTSPSAIQVKNRPKTISTEGKLDVISWLEKGEWIVDLRHNVISIHTVHDNADRITEYGKSGTEVFV